MVGNLEAFLYLNIFKNKVNFQQNFNILLIYNQTNIRNDVYKDMFWFVNVHFIE